MKEEKKKHLKLHRRFITGYKKNSGALFLCFVLSIILFTVMLVLLHTNFQIGNLQLKTEFTPSDFYIDDLSFEQTEKLKQDPDVEWTAMEQGESRIYQKNNQQVHLIKSDDHAPVMMAGVLEGSLPKNKGEIVAERWTLMNLGIQPSAGQTVQLENQDTGEIENFFLTGILSDIYGNKKYGLLSLYTPMDKGEQEGYLAYVKLKDGVDYQKKVKELKTALEISADQLKECPARADMKELYFQDGEMIGILLAVCLIIFYGVYRITFMARVELYGTLRAVGMKKGELKKMMVLELYQLYLASIPVGVLLGIFLAHMVMAASGDYNLEIYLNQETVRFRPVIPWGGILLSILAMAAGVGLIGYKAGCRAAKTSVTELLAGDLGKKEKKADCFSIEKAKTKTGFLVRMGGKYLFKDWQMGCFLMLTVCVGAVLFTGLAYQAKIEKIHREDTKELYYLNGEYALTMQFFNLAEQGISRENGEKIKALSSVRIVKTSSSLPVRVIDEGQVKRNEAYYMEHNERMEEIYGYGDAGFDGKNQVYKSQLCGYNTEALKALKPYVVEGDYDPEHMGEDEVILWVMRTDDSRQGQPPGNYKEGTPLMEYHPGDEIQIKYRADLKTDSLEYEAFRDEGEAYVYRTFRVAAVVSFGYMYDCNRNVYPLLITTDSCIQKIAPDSGFQCMYLDGAPGMTKEEQSSLEHKLIELGSRNNNISTRSLLSEIRQNEMFYYKQMVYIYGIGIVVFFLALLNIRNNLRYRMQARTREISMLRAIGLSIPMTKRMLFFENIFLGMAGILLAFICLQPVLRGLYHRSQMQAFGHGFAFAYGEFLLIAAVTLGLCGLLSFRILKIWKSRRIVEGIGNFK